MEDQSTTSEARSAECCDICGDKGVIDAIVTCTRCKVSCEHLYCMRICLVDHPENWCCKDCECRNEKVSPNSGMREEFAKDSAAHKCKKLPQDSTQSNKPCNDSRQNFFDRRKRVISGKTKPLSVEEVIMLSSGAKTCVSPVKRLRSNSVLRKNSATPVKSSNIYSKFSLQPVKAHPASMPAPSKNFKPARPTSPQMNVGAQQQVQGSFKGLRGGATLLDLKLQRTASSVNHLADPSLDASWNGSFKVSSASKHWDISEEIQAHPPSRVLKKVYEFSKLMPEVLQFELVARQNLWVDILQQFCLDKRDIGLYFFPRNRKRWENYVILLQFMESEDLAMRTRVEGMELLIFTSKLLSRDCQTWNGRHFLWGVFKKKTGYAIQVHACGHHTELDSSEVDMDIDMIGGKDVGRTDIAVSKESLQPTLPDMTVDMKIDAIGGKDVGKMDIVFSKESLQLPPSNVTTEVCGDIPPGFENIYHQRIQNSCSFMDQIGQIASLNTERLHEESHPIVNRQTMGTSMPKGNSSQIFSNPVPPLNVKTEY